MWHPWRIRGLFYDVFLCYVFPMVYNVLPSSSVLFLYLSIFSMFFSAEKMKSRSLGQIGNPPCHRQPLFLPCEEGTYFCPDDLMLIWFTSSGFSCFPKEIGQKYCNIMLPFLVENLNVWGLNEAHIPSVPPLVVVLCAYAVRQHGHGGPGRFIRVGWFQPIFKWWVNTTSETQSTLL